MRDLDETEQKEKTPREMAKYYFERAIHSQIGSTQLEFWLKKLRETGDPFYNYCICRCEKEHHWISDDVLTDEQRRAHEQVVIDSKDPKMNFWFANLPGADVKAHGQVIIDSKDPLWNFLYALLIDGADIKTHEQVVIDSKDLNLNFQFAVLVKEADVRAHGQVIIDSKDPLWNFTFAGYFKGVSWVRDDWANFDPFGRDVDNDYLAPQIYEHRPRVFSIFSSRFTDDVDKYTFPGWSYLCFSDSAWIKMREAHARLHPDSDRAPSCFIEDLDIEDYANVVIESGHPYFNLLFAKYVKGSDVKAHTMAILRSDEDKEWDDRPKGDEWYSMLEIAQGIGPRKYSKKDFLYNLKTTLRGEKKHQYRKAVREYDKSMLTEYREIAMAITTSDLPSGKSLPKEAFVQDTPTTSDTPKAK